MIRNLLLWLSDRRSVFTFIRNNRLARRLASRFVAGESIGSAVSAARNLNGHGITASLDLLGESVTSVEESHAARDEVVRTLDAIASSGVAANVSMKLTQMGLDIDRSLCLDNTQAVLRRANELGIFVRIDMESSVYTQHTLDLFYDDLYPEFRDTTGVVIQSYMRRSADDVDRLVEMGARVRLCKGAYAEPEAVAFETRREVNRSFVSLMRQLLDHGTYPAIASHDEEMIQATLRHVEEHAIPPERFEFQMLFGVRRDWQQVLRQKGYNMRVYIPFGSNWYPYLMRRLAERPANLKFMAASVAKESVSRS